MVEVAVSELIIYCDGAASGNPGPAGIGGYAILDGEEAFSFSEAIGHATNNVAEYRALVFALDQAASLKADSVTVFTDSELMARQLTGRYQVKNQGLKELFGQATALLGAYEHHDVKHIPRTENARADDLACQAIADERPAAKPGASRPRITFTSDFGEGDGWTGVVRAVVTDINPAAEIIDLAHDIPAFDIRKGAFVLATAVPYVTAAAHLAVVDPGVGGQRRPVIIEAANAQVFVGPDNGLLLPAVERSGGATRAFSITNPKYLLEDTWATFDARSVFAPAAAHISAGVPLAELGSEVSSSTLAPSPWMHARMSAQGIEAEIIDIDRFGTARLNIDAADFDGLGLRTGSDVELSWSGKSVMMRIERTFGDVTTGDPVSLVDSSGFLSAAVNTGSAAEKFGLYVGLRIHLLSR